MQTIGIKKHSNVKGLGIKQHTALKGLGVKGVFYKNNMIMPKGEPLQITGIVNKSNVSGTEFMPKGLRRMMK